MGRLLSRRSLLKGGAAVAALHVSRLLTAAAARGRSPVGGWRSTGRPCRRRSGRTVGGADDPGSPRRRRGIARPQESRARRARRAAADAGRSSRRTPGADDRNARLGRPPRQGSEQARDVQGGHSRSTLQERSPRQQTTHRVRTPRSARRHPRSGCRPRPPAPAPTADRRTRPPGVLQHRAAHRFVGLRGARFLRSSRVFSSISTAPPSGDQTRDEEGRRGRQAADERRLPGAAPRPRAGVAALDVSE